VPALVVAASSSRDNFVDIDVSLIAWVGLAIAIALMLAVDLYRHRDDHEPTAREALLESSVWVMCGLAFGGVVAVAYGGDAFGEYISGYLIEKSLSVDNVFVWSILFSTEIAFAATIRSRPLNETPVASRMVGWPGWNSAPFASAM